MVLGLKSARASLRNRGNAKLLESKEYDYIVVGGGTAGCVLANRLSADPECRVLVLEAGTAPPTHPLVRIPVAILKLFKSKWDWNFATESAAETGERPLYLCRGKGLGGSSCINVMLYTRGAASDYDRWAEACGDDTWASPYMLEYFKKAEKCTSAEATSPQYHGFHGPHPVSDVPYQNEMSAAFLTAAAEEHPAHWGRNNDFNDWSRPQEGFGRYQVAQERGARVTAASAYLTDEVRARPNLDVVVDASVRRVVFDEAKTAVAVEVDFGNRRATAKLANKGEVVSCGGAIGSPQLLLLSGIGPQTELAPHGIEQVADLPGVGAGLADHPACLVSYTGSDAAKGKSHSSALRVPGTRFTNPKAIYKWAVAGDGPLTSPGCDHGGFVRSAVASDTDADIQFRFLATKTITPDGMSTIADSYKAVANHPDGFTVQCIAARPKSRSGRVSLRSADPRDKAKIQDVYLTDDHDVAVLVDALKKAREIATQPALSSYRGVEEYPGAAATDDADLAAYVRKTVHSANALVGTCKLGKAGDPSSVVDNELKVMGVSGLRVCDSSIMPNIPGGQTCSSTIAIAEKAADLIKRAGPPAPLSRPSLQMNFDTNARVTVDAKELASV